MKYRREPLCATLILLVVQFGNVAFADKVTFNVKTTAGTAGEDVVVVFDPIGISIPAQRASAIVDQIHKRFVPIVSVVRTGTTINFPNSDQIRHQVYSFSPAKVFTLKLYAGSPQAGIVFDKPGLVVLGCNIHDSMLAYVVVVDSPYFAKIPASGKGTLDLPVGRYRMRVWHPDLKATVPPTEIVVGSNSKEIPLSVDLLSGSETVAEFPE